MDRKKLKTVTEIAALQTMPSQRELAEHRRAVMRRAVQRLKSESESSVRTLITAQQTWSIPKPPPGVIPEGAVMAMDAAIDGYSQWAMNYSLFAEGQAFLGYPYLAELSQRPEYRVISETWAHEMTRKWIKFTSTGDTSLKDKADKIKAIEDAFKLFHVQDHIKRCVELDGFMGRSHLHIDLGVDTQNREELMSSIGDSTSRLARVKVRKGALKGFKVIEPVWTYPNSYNANDPLKFDFFQPKTWFVMGQEIHHTRLLTFVGRPMPDLLKPMYSFGGLSLSQMAKPYVDNWLRTRQSVSDAISNFSIMVMLTDLSSMLNDNAVVDLEARADFFNAVRDNRGLMLADKNTEDLKNVSMPISGLDHLQAQSQEHMCSVTQIPLVKLTGISPSGLNATSDNEVRVFYDRVEASQESNLRTQIGTILNVVQLHLFGEIDPEIGFEFEKLYNVDDTEAATISKTEADTDSVYIDAGVITPQEVRVKLANRPDSPYASLDTSEEALPQPPDTQQPGQETDEQGNSLDTSGAGGEQDDQHPDIPDQPHTAGSIPQGNAGAKLQQRPITSKPVAGGKGQAHDFNPHHDTHTGEFTSGGGAAGSPKKSPSSGKSKGTLPDSSPLLKDSREDQSPVAQAERTSIVNKALEHAKPVTGRKPVIYIMGGGGGAGKGTLRAQLQGSGEMPSEKDGAVVVDPDGIKEQMKRYQDVAKAKDYRAASVVHEDSSEMSKYILKTARDNNCDVVFDATMSDFKKGMQKIQEFKDAGYEVRMYNVLADPEAAVDRAQKRFESTGRYVDPDVLRHAHQNFAQIVKQYEHIADKFKTYSNYDKMKLERSSEDAAHHIDGMPVDKADMLTRALGSILQQDSMARVSVKPFKGSSEMGAVVIAVPKDMGYKDVKKMYNELRSGVKGSDGESLINGHTTDAGRMVILVDKGSEDSIGRQVDQCLGGKYDVGTDTLNVAWPEKGGDDYGFQGKDQSGKGSTESSLREWLHSVHTKAADKLQERIGEHEAKG